MSSCRLAAAGIALAVVLVGQAADPPRDQAALFEQQVRPILRANCYTCHSHAGGKTKGGLALDARSSALKGGDTGPAIVPGKPDESLLIKAVSQVGDLKMPLKGKLADEQVKVLRDWIERGASWPETEPKLAARPRGVISDEDRRWWAFQPPRAVDPPAVADAAWNHNPIDRFVRARLDAVGLSPSPPADRRALIRRVTFDLTGLPPTPAEVEAFVGDRSPGAYERLVDRLLDSPRYGERAGRLWLDVVRYAESDGFRIDDFRPGAWRYRDYVIRSFIADKPYDRFLREQLAGDEIAPDDPDALVAVGFLRNGIYEYNNRDVRGQRENMLNELADCVGDAFLGLGMACARCHDHKFDPILQKDYYRLRAVFAGLSFRDDWPVATDRQRAEYRAQLSWWEDATKDVRAKIESLEAPMRAKAEHEAVAKFADDLKAILAADPAGRSPEEQQIADLAYRQVLYEFHRLDRNFKDEQKQQLVALRKELAKFDHLKPSPLPEGLSARDVGPVAATTTLPKKREAIEPGVPSVFDAKPLGCTPGKATTGRRTAFADWLTRPEHPLTARVAVNRVWQQHFGVGLVATASDFGTLGEKPSHPELLNWLARRFVTDGWRFKPLHRLIVTSQTYRQSATHPAPAAGLVKDPENRLLGRATTRRLDAEQVRDALLAATGKLDLISGGPSVEPTKPRRTVYTKVMRNTRDPLLEVFDAPESFASAGRRNVTTTPTQALLLINSPFMLGQAQAFADRLRKEQPDDAARVESAYRLALGRPPTAEERSTALQFLAEQAGRINPAPDATASIQYGKVQYREGRAALVQPGGPMGRLGAAENSKLPAGDFTAEAFVTLRSTNDDGTVRPIVAHWSGDKTKPGWAFGVTSKRSAYKPQVLVLQLCGEDAAGKFAFEPVFSNLHVDLNKPYFVAVSVSLHDTAAGGVTFYAKDLSNDDEPLQVSQVPHHTVRLPAGRGPLTIGGDDSKSTDHSWDGLIDDVRLSSGPLPVERLLLTAEGVSDRTCGYWQFEPLPGFFEDTSANGLHLTPAKAVNGRSESRDPRTAALADFCHVLLNANEFLYVD